MGADTSFAVGAPVVSGVGAPPPSVAGSVCLAHQAVAAGGWGPAGRSLQPEWQSRVIGLLRSPVIFLLKQEKLKHIIFCVIIP